MASTMESQGQSRREKWRERARALQNELYALYLAYRHPDTPWYAKAWALLVLAYAFSPIDLIPDMIPILGYVDDVILLPMGIYFALRLIPAEILAETRGRAQQELAVDPSIQRKGTFLIVCLWLLVIGVTILVIWRITDA